MPESQNRTAAHIGPICLELGKLARQADLRLLAHLFEMASLECLNIEIATMAEEHPKLYAVK